MEKNWPNNNVFNYIPTQQRLGNKTLFTNTINNGTTQTRYFSGTDAEIYFEEKYIDEVVQIQYQVQQNTMPLFGYNSYVYDQVARGSRIINGSFTINFTKANYLYDVLNVLSGQIIAPEKTINKDAEATIDEFDESLFVGGEIGSLYMGKTDGPMWDKTFEIVLSYGDARQTNLANSSTMLTLTGVVLTGCSQVLGINGDPVYETYTFIARDILSIASISNSTKTEESDDYPIIAMSDDSAITIETLSYSEDLNTITNDPYGTINLEYRSSQPVYDIQIQLNGLSIQVPMTIMATQGQYVRTLPSSITYRVPDSWRELIRKYYNDKLSSYAPNILTINADLAFTYENGRKEILKGKLKLETVYTDKK